MTNFLPEANDKLTLWAVGSGYCSKEERRRGASNLPVLSVKKKYYLQSGNFDYLGATSIVRICEVRLSDEIKKGPF